jgi:hypothetical protein
VHGPFHNLHLLYRHRTLALQRGQFGKLRLQMFTEHGAAGTYCCSGTDPSRSLTMGQLQNPCQEPGEVGEAI